MWYSSVFHINITNVLFIIYYLEHVHCIVFLNHSVVAFAPKTSKFILRFKRTQFQCTWTWHVVNSLNSCHAWLLIYKNFNSFQMYSRYKNQERPSMMPKSCQSHLSQVRYSLWETDPMYSVHILSLSNSQSQSPQFFDFYWNTLIAKFKFVV